MKSKNCFDRATAKTAVGMCEELISADIRAAHSEEHDGSEDTDAMLARTAARSGIRETELHRGQSKRLKMKGSLFGTEGGEA